MKNSEYDEEQNVDQFEANKFAIISKLSILK